MFLNDDQQKIANVAGSTFERRTQIITLLGALQALVGEDFEISVNFKRQYSFGRSLGMKTDIQTAPPKVVVKTAIMQLGEDSAFPVVEG